MVHAKAQVIDTISIHQAYTFLGKEVVLRGKIASSRRVDTIKGAPTFLNLKEDTTMLTVVIWEEAARLFKIRPDSVFIKGATVFVRGNIGLYRGKAQIVVRDPKHIQKQ